MKKVLLSLFLLTAANLAAQSTRVGNPQEWLESRAPLKVMLISAEWCAYCRETRSIFEQSDELQKIEKEGVAFFEFPEMWPDPFRFEEKAYQFHSSGPNLGRHAFVQEMLNQTESAGFPLFLIYDSRNQSYVTYSSMLSESDWISVLGAILNQRAVPDSVSNN